MINGLDIFTGIGGMSLALCEWVRPIAYCEIDPFCQSVLLSRMQKGDLPKAPIWDDISTLQYSDIGIDIDIIYAGFPCQGFSIAGLGKGLEDERSGLFQHVLRLAKEIKPTFIFLENVPAITQRGGVEIVNEITKMGYDCRWLCLSASEVGAPHKRERWFLLAHTNRKGSSRLPIRKEKRKPQSKLCAEPNEWDTWPENESSLLRVDDGISYRMDQTRALGNSVVIQQVKKTFKMLIGIDYEME